MHREILRLKYQLAEAIAEKSMEEQCAILDSWSEQLERVIADYDDYWFIIYNLEKGALQHLLEKLSHEKKLVIIRGAIEMLIINPERQIQDQVIKDILSSMTSNNAKPWYLKHLDYLRITDQKARAQELIATSGYKNAVISCANEAQRAALLIFLETELASLHGPISQADIAAGAFAFGPDAAGGGGGGVVAPAP